MPLVSVSSPYSCPPRHVAGELAFPNLPPRAAHEPESRSQAPLFADLDLLAEPADPPFKAALAVSGYSLPAHLSAADGNWSAMRGVADHDGGAGVRGSANDL